MLLQASRDREKTMSTGEKKKKKGRDDAFGKRRLSEGFRKRKVSRSTACVEKKRGTLGKKRALRRGGNAIVFAKKKTMPRFVRAASVISEPLDPFVSFSFGGREKKIPGERESQKGGMAVPSPRRLGEKRSNGHEEIRSRLGPRKRGK